MTHVYQRYHAAAASMDALIDMTPTPTDSSREAVTARAAMRMQRLREFLGRIGDPHIGRPIVHVGGTSGKGSTSTVITSILTAAGYRTGLHTSPYLQTPAEKLQVGGRLISPDAYADLVDEFMRAHDAWLADGKDPLTYGEAFNVLMWMYFRAEDVDICVVEVGAGGRFDLTNILEPTLSVITSVGIDHTATLGKTIADIAWHKAGIIKPGKSAVSGVPNLEAQAIIREEAETVGAPLLQVDLDVMIRDIQIDANGTHWIEEPGDIQNSMRMAGSFQARNGQLAVVAARSLRDLGFSISDEAIAEGLLKARIPGRAEIVKDVVPVVLDGAHNAEKVAAFAQDVPQLAPIADGGKRIVVAGLLEAKQGDEMIPSLIPVTDVLIATSPKVLAKDAMVTSEIEQFARNAGFDGEVILEPEPLAAIQRAIELAEAGDAVVVTGSLYLVGNIRERWFPEAAILEAQSCWPSAVTHGV